MKKVWVVGSQGLVARQICLDLAKKGIAFVASNHTQVDALDIRALENFYDKHLPTYVINGVAHVRVDAAEGEQKELCYALNREVVENLAHLCANKGVKLIHISTDYVFDGTSKSDYEVEDPVNPLNVYGKAKLEGEQMLFKICPGACCVRTASVYGLTKPGLITGMMDALQTKESVEHVVDQISSPTNAKDLSQAIIDVMNAKGIFQFVNAGSCSRFALLQFVYDFCLSHGIKMTCKRLKALEQKQSGRSAKRPRRSVLSNKKIAPLLSFSIRSWQEALRAYLKEHLEHAVKH